MSQTTKNALRAYIKQAAENLKTARNLEDALYWEAEMLRARAELKKLSEQDTQDLNF